MCDALFFEKFFALEGEEADIPREWGGKGQSISFVDVVVYIGDDFFFFFFCALGM